MDKYQALLGVIATIIGIVGYIPYFISIFAGRTRPHAFSWFVWAVMTGIAFAAQLKEGAGPGAWVTGLTTAACFVICVLGLWKGTKTFPLFDWIALVVSGLSLLLWYTTNDPTMSVVLITLIDAVSYLPTFRKGYYRPWEETASTFALSGIKFVPGILALETFTLATVLYPASLVLTNGLFVALLLVRRRAVKP